ALRKISGGRPARTLPRLEVSASLIPASSSEYAIARRTWTSWNGPSSTSSEKPRQPPDTYVPTRMTDDLTHVLIELFGTATVPSICPLWSASRRACSSGISGKTIVSHGYFFPL